MSRSVWRDRSRICGRKAVRGKGASVNQFAPMALPDTLTIPAVAESILAAMPPNADSSLRRILPAGGRQLLAFSDSRRQAARLGPHLTYQHEYLLSRVLITRVLADALDIEALKQEISKAESEMSMLSPQVRTLLEVGLDKKRKSNTVPTEPVR